MNGENRDMGAAALRAAAQKLEDELALQEQLYAQQTRNVPHAKQPFYPTAIAAARTALRAALAAGEGKEAPEVEAIAKEITTLVANEVMCPEHGYGGPESPIVARVAHIIESRLVGAAPSGAPE